MRYAYAFTAALLLGGSSVALVNGTPVTAQVAQNENAASAPRGAPMSFADLTERLQPAVVNISTKQTVKVPDNPFGGVFGEFFNRRGSGQPQTREAQSLGSGFIISADGYIATNNHVIAPGNASATVESITVILPDRTEYEAELVGRDVASDLAVLKIKAKGDLPFVKFGDSARTRVGDWVIAIGNPFGLGGTVTAGIISAVYRTTGSGAAYDRYLQTDASINSGNSGGPMFDLNGNVVGINNAIISPTGGSVGIGFAIPAEVAAPIIDQLRKGKTVERGYLGIQFQPLNEDLAASLGVDKNHGSFVQSVVPGEAADQAGIQAGDVVSRINGEEITPDNTLAYIVANIPVGTKVPVEVIRDGKRRRLSVTIGKRPSEETLAQNFAEDPQEDFSDQDQSMSQEATEDLIGVAVTELTDNIRRQLGLVESVEGVVITAVDPNGDAGRKGLRRGFVIMSVDNSPVRTTAEFEAAVEAAKRANKTAVLLRVKPRGQNAQFVPVRLRAN